MTRTDGVTDSDRTNAMLVHIVAYLFSFIAPLIILFASDREFVRKNARRALNWQLSVVVYLFVLLFCFLTGFSGGALAFLGVVALIAYSALGILDLVFIIIASVRAGTGRVFDYPLTIPFVRDPKLSSEKR